MSEVDSFQINLNHKLLEANFHFPLLHTRIRSISSSRGVILMTTFQFSNQKEKLATLK